MAGPRQLTLARRQEDDGDPLARMLAADERAVRAAHRLRALRSRALSGEGHDPAAYDAAILAHRAAQGEAAAARLTWVRWSGQETDAARAA
jgi:hypothetical protein